MKLIIFLALIFSLFTSAHVWAFSNKLTYTVPLWVVDNLELAQSKCNELDLKLRGQVNGAEKKLGVVSGTVRLSTKTLVRGQSMTDFYTSPEFSCAFNLSDTSGQLSISKKMKRNYWLNSEEIDSESYCLSELSEVRADAQNVGVYRDLGVSLMQGDFCTVYFVKIALRK